MQLNQHIMIYQYIIIKDILQPVHIKVCYLIIFNLILTKDINYTKSHVKK